MYRNKKQTFKEGGGRFCLWKNKRERFITCRKSRSLRNGLLYKFKTAVEIEIDLMDIPLGADMKFDEKAVKKKLKK